MLRWGSGEGNPVRALCRCEKKEKRVSHGGTATTAFLEEVERWFVRCERCVAVRKKEKRVSHGGTANTARGEKSSQVCAL
jgi:hypothetical protein